MASLTRHSLHLIGIGCAGIFCTWLYMRKKICVAPSAVSEEQKDEVPVSRCGCIIKLGGSACTNKSIFETFNFAEVSRFSEQFADVCASSPEFRAIVLHGAGSFGHFQAKQYSVGSGTSKSSGVEDGRVSFFLREGFSKTRLSVTSLNHHIVTTMIQKGISAVGVSPFPTVPISRRRLLPGPWESALVGSLDRILALDLVPVLHGDACIDTSGQKTGILSGDTLFVYLCRKFRPPHAVFLADVDGVLTGPPSSEPPPVLVKRILVHADGTWDAPEISTSTHSHDVTGGIKQKIMAAVEIASALGIPVYIVKAGSRDAELAIRGQPPLNGTTVLRAVP